MSVFAVQREIEDYLASLGLSDSDQYAVRLANLYAQRRAALDTETFRQKMSSLRTVFYRINRRVDRGEFEELLLQRLDRKYLKKNPALDQDFPGGVFAERQEIRRTGRRTIGALLDAFAAAVEARAVDPFWESRSARILRPRPEVIGQGLLAVFARGVLEQGGGLVFREFASGVGYVDIGIVFAKTLYLVEIKVLSGGGLTGPEQLGEYMRTEGRGTGWLVVLDARSQDGREGSNSPEVIELDSGIVRVKRIDINPIPPSRIHRARR